jgi:hypothetical protein
VTSDRNAVYVPFDMNQFMEESGPAYDSNFIALKANVQYIMEISAVIVKDPSQTSSTLSFYFTSSIPAAQQEPTYNNTFGINIANIIANTVGDSSVNFNNLIAFYTPQNDLYGTLVVVPYLCQAYIESISFRVYGDDGFSPDVFSTTIPWPVITANECFDIKAELFDINNNLVYSDLETLQSFDPSGSTLIPYLPESAQDLIVCGSLYVSKSIEVGHENITIDYGDVFIPNIFPRPTGTAISQSRVVSVASDGSLVFDPIVDVNYDSAYNQYIYLTLDVSSNRLDGSKIFTVQSLASNYNSLAGRKIYWVNGVKHVESGSQ